MRERLTLYHRLTPTPLKDPIVGSKRKRKYKAGSEHLRPSKKKRCPWSSLSSLHKTFQAFTVTVLGIKSCSTVRFTGMRRIWMPMSNQGTTSNTHRYMRHRCTYSTSSKDKAGSLGYSWSYNSSTVLQRIHDRQGYTLAHNQLMSWHYWVLGPVAQSENRHPSKTLQNTAEHCRTLQKTAEHCRTLQNTAEHCRALQNTARNWTQQTQKAAYQVLSNTKYLLLLFKKGRQCKAEREWCTVVHPISPKTQPHNINL